MDQPPTETPPPARPAPTRETVGELAQVLTHLIQASYELTRTE